MAEPKKLNVKNEAHYKNSTLVYPDQNIPPDKKAESYHRMECEKIYGLMLNGNTWISNDSRASISELRKWSNGIQDTRFTLDLIFGTKETPVTDSAWDATGKDIRDISQVQNGKKAWANLDLTPVSVAPKIKTKINEHARAMYYELNVKAIDSYSSSVEETEKYSLWFYKENKKWIDSQRIAAGIGVSEPSFMPRNLDELELYAASGGFKVPYSITMEDLLKHTFEVSEWDKEVAERIKDDLMTVGYGMIQDVFNKEINREVVEYRDIEHCGMQYSPTKSFKNSEFAYSERMVEISSIRQRLGLTDEEALSLAHAYVGQYGNPTKERWSNYSSRLGEGDTSYLGCDSFKVPEFNCEWIDIDNEKYIKFTDKYDREKTKNYKGEIQDNETLMDNQIRYVRKCSWIVGTDYIYDWGKCEYIPKDKYGVPRLSYRGVMLSTTPIIVQILPFLRGFQLAWVKTQHAISQAIGNGFAVDIGSITNISIGKDKSYDPMEVLKFYKQSSFLVYKTSKSLSGFGRSVAPPVVPLNNSSHENIKAGFDSMVRELSLIDTTCGISGISTGEQADPNVAKFNMQISLQGTNEIINNIVRAVTDLQEDVSVNVGYRIRTLCHMNKVVADSYAEVVGKSRMKAFLDAEKNNIEYGMSIEASDISEEKRNIMTMLQAFIAPAPDGSNHMAEGLQIMDMLRQRQNLRRIGLILGYKMEKLAEKQQADKEANIKAQNDQLAILEDKKIQAAKQVQDYEFEVIDRKFWADFTVKWGKPPDQAFGSPETIQQQAVQKFSSDSAQQGVQAPQQQPELMQTQ